VTHLLGAEPLRMEYATRVVLDSVTLEAEESDHVGAVGRDGDGKSSLLATQTSSWQHNPAAAAPLPDSTFPRADVDLVSRRASHTVTDKIRTLLSPCMHGFCP